MAPKVKRPDAIGAISFDMDDLSELGLTPEQATAVASKLRQQQALAARELEEVRVNFRWKAGFLARVKLAAQSKGLPYQRYMKDVLYRQATDDLIAAGHLVNIPPPQ